MYLVQKGGIRYRPYFPTLRLFKEYTEYVVSKNENPMGLA